MSENNTESTRDLRDYLHILRRRKWVVIAAVCLTPIVALVYALQQPSLYRATSKVVLATDAVGGTTLVGSSSDDTRDLATDAELASDPVIAKQAITAAHVANRTPQQLLAETAIAPESTSDVLDFSVTDESSADAAALARAYADRYSSFLLALNTSFLNRTRVEVEARLAALSRAGDHSSPTYLALVQKDDQLVTLEGLQTTSTYLILSGGAAKVQPRPTLDAGLGLVLGILLGLGLALLLDGIDTRVRSADEIAELIGVPLLGRLPEPSRKLRVDDGLAMLADQTSAQAEAYRMLRTNFDFANVDRLAKTVMISSAIENEGKSTTISNLAVALARNGQRVVLVDLDLRRPYLDRFFLHARASLGVTSVAIGEFSLKDALVHVALEGSAIESPAPAANGHTQNGKSRMGMLDVLPTGPVPPDPGEFFATHALSELLDELKRSYDFVLLDAPPLLRFGDATALSAVVDAVLLVTRLKVVRRQMLVEVRRLLTTSPATTLGFIVTGASAHSDDHYYGSYYYSYRYRHEPERTRPAATSVGSGSTPERP